MISVAILLHVSHIMVTNCILELTRLFAPFTETCLRWSCFCQWSKIVNKGQWTLLFTVLKFIFLSPVSTYWLSQELFFTHGRRHVSVCWFVSLIRLKLQNGLLKNSPGFFFLPSLTLQDRPFVTVFVKSSGNNAWILTRKIRHILLVVSIT